MKVIVFLIITAQCTFMPFFISFAVDTGNTPPDDERFVTDGTTVHDSRTGLMWAAQDNGADISMVAAQTYCENYVGGGYHDWRLPTQDELATLFDLEVSGGSGYYIVSDIRLTGCCPWASDRKDERVASYDFEYGSPDWGYPMSTINARALPVRDAPELKDR